jgi:hypothetical protein
MIDWFYAAGRLRMGGVVIVDDIHLPAVEMLVDAVAYDRRWQVVARTAKWIAYERKAEWSMREDWWEQTFMPSPRPSTPLARRVLGRAKRVARKTLTRGA